MSSAELLRALRVAAAAAAVVAVIRLAFGGSTALYVNGAAAGVLYGLMAVGLILIYRSNRFINLSVSAIGAVPAMVALIGMTSRGWSYWIGLPIALVGGLLVGGVVEVVVIRRFAGRSRFTLTVVTLGIAQGLAFVALLVPGWMGSEVQQSLVDTPWSGVVARSGGRPVVTGDQVFAVVAVAVLCAGLALFLRRSRLGIGLRAAAENAGRAELLGVPVRRVQTVAWVFAGLLGAASIFLRAPLTGVPLDGTLGPGILLFALAVASVARFSSVGVALVAGMVVGILEQASVTKTGSGDLAYALMLAVVFAALVLRRPDYVRGLSADEADWDSTQTVRPLPRRLARLPEIQGVRAVLVLASLAVAVVAPLLVTEGQIGNLTTIPLYGLVAVSLVVLSGWAGQMSLGQFGLVGVGALLGGSWAAGHGVDLFLALAVGVGGAALVAGLLAIPAVRVQGVYLAVVTMAFAGAMQFYFLDRRYLLGDVGLLPSGFARIERPVLWGRIDLGDDLAFYYVVLAFLALVVTAVAAMRRNRGGRVLMGIRDNAKEASAMGLSVPRTRLAAFMVSGGIAGLAGTLMAYQQGAVDPQVYGIDTSMLIFIVVVIGGVTSLAGALAATAVIIWVRLFGDTYLFAHAELLVTGPGLLVVLLIVPGGFADVIFRGRDRLARWGDGRSRPVRRPSTVPPHVPAGVGE